LIVLIFCEFDQELEAERDMYRQTMVAAISDAAVSQDAQSQQQGGMGSRAAEIAASIGGRFSMTRLGGVFGLGI
jgi:hypothetical protein